MNWSPKRYTVDVPITDQECDACGLGLEIINTIERQCIISRASLDIDILDDYGKLGPFPAKCYRTAFTKGFTAHYLGEDLLSNPYNHSYYRKCWHDGWVKAQRLKEKS